VLGVLGLLGVMLMPRIVRGRDVRALSVVRVLARDHLLPVTCTAAWATLLTRTETRTLPHTKKRMHRLQ
jgi:hypothetical protein